MSLHIRERVELQPYNTLSLPGTAQRFAAVNCVDELQQAVALAAAEQWPVTLLGGGSNVVLATDLPGLVIQMAIPGVALVSDNPGSVQLRIGAGEDWHQLVLHCLDNGWYGLENLSLIPGTVGAAPVQNIGAYGVELADRMMSVEVVDLATGQLSSLDCQACEFGYRDSIFKRELRGKVAIVAVTLELLKQPRLQLSYPALQQAVCAYQSERQSGRGATPEVTPCLVSELVCRIRRRKLPDPARIANAGSFFKNPLVPSQTAGELQRSYPDMAMFPAADGQVKLAAGWLIERTGWKGRSVGDIAVHDKQALVLVNRGNGTGGQLLAVADQVVASVEDMFGVTLEIEPRVLPEKTVQSTCA